MKAARFYAKSGKCEGSREIEHRRGQQLDDRTAVEIDYSRDALPRKPALARCSLFFKQFSRPGTTPPLRSLVDISYAASYRGTPPAWLIGISLCFYWFIQDLARHLP
jgi:hypothetical protein